MKRAALVNYSSVDISDFVLKLRKKVLIVRYMISLHLISSIRII